MFGDYSSVGFTVRDKRVTSRPFFRVDDCTDNRTELQPGKSQQFAGNV